MIQGVVYAFVKLLTLVLQANILIYTNALLLILNINICKISLLDSVNFVD